MVVVLLLLVVVAAVTAWRGVVYCQPNKVDSLHIPKVESLTQPRKSYTPDRTKP